MIVSLPAALRKTPPALCLLALTSIPTGCASEHGEPLFPYMHPASRGGGGQLVTVPPTDLRHHAHATGVAQPRRHAPASKHQGPKA
jgi:hypothetical protein